MLKDDVFINKAMWERQARENPRFVNRRYFRHVGKMTKSGRVVRDEPDVKYIRSKYNMTQEELAWLMNISVHTLRNWEQGRRKPKGPSKILLRLVSLYPHIIRDLRSAHNATR